MDSYRTEMMATMKIILADEDAEIEPIPIGSGGWKPKPELDRFERNADPNHERTVTSARHEVGL
jgi:hypothetical protein